MEHIREFSKNVDTYDAYTPIQKKVAKQLIKNLGFQPQNILDLGSGTGEVYRQINWPLKRFVAVDYSQNMCKVHPKSQEIEVINEDFESLTCKEKLLQKGGFECVVSASALQWAKDIKGVFASIKELSPRCALAIFTDKTFADIYSVSKLKTFLPSSESIIQGIEPYFDCEYELKTHRVEFTDTLEMFRYIKKSGVSGGKRRLNISETKALMQNYPHNYLEFEVLYLWSKDK